MPVGGDYEKNWSDLPLAKGVRNNLCLYAHMGVSWNGGTPKWKVYNGKSHLEMDDDWGFRFLGNPHILYEQRAYAMVMNQIALVSF